MRDISHTSSRRSLLGRAFVVAAGAVGLGSGAESAAATRNPTTLRLYGRHVHLYSPARTPGEVPIKGEQFTTYAELAERPDGPKAGHFTAVFVATDSPFADGAGSVELHSFALEGGTIHGMGTAVAGAAGEFAVVGGTGRFAGTRGTYAAVLEPRELGGGGSAEFTFTLER